MQTYDVIMLVVLIGATVFGAWKGLAWQLASLASIFVSYYVAYRFRGEVAELIDATSPWNTFLAMLLLFVGTSFVIWWIFNMVSSFIDRLRLKEFDRQIGALFGFAKGVVICAIITLFAMTLLGPKQRESIVESQSGYYIALLLDRAHAVMPEEIHDVLEPYIHQLDGRLENGEETPEKPPEKSSGVKGIFDRELDSADDKSSDDSLGPFGGI